MPGSPSQPEKLSATFKKSMKVEGYAFGEMHLAAKKIILEAATQFDKILFQGVFS